MTRGTRVPPLVSGRARNGPSTLLGRSQRPLDPDDLINRLNPRAAGPPRRWPWRSLAPLHRLAVALASRLPHPSGVWVGPGRSA